MKQPVLLIVKHPIVGKSIEDAIKITCHERRGRCLQLFAAKLINKWTPKRSRNTKWKFVECKKQKITGDMFKKRLEESVFRLVKTGLGYFIPFEARFTRE